CKLLCPFETYEVTLVVMGIGVQVAIRSDDEDDTLIGTPSPNFHATLAGGCLATTYDLSCKGPRTGRIFGRGGFWACDLWAPRPRPYH
ncbi:hypothetical protein AVEN_95160-1, partial [Araneus ventricosus]